MLDRQVSLYRVDTNAFLNSAEKKEKESLDVLYKEKNRLESEKPEGYKEKVAEIEAEIKSARKVWKTFLLKSAKECVAYNETHEEKHIRELDEKYLYYKDTITGEPRRNLMNVVSMFESALSRGFGCKVGEITLDIFILEVYYFDIAQDLIRWGFNYQGKHYIYFSSSAGQIRTKKCVFVEEEKYRKIEPKLMCGLTVDYINQCGGMNVNKFLAYLALANSATDLWENVLEKPFDIDRAIVVDDFETLVHGKVDYIDEKTYKIQPSVEMDVPIPHTDGCGLISSDYCKKNFMVRLPFIKGLLGSFDFKRFVEVNKCSPIVKDIWGAEHNVMDVDVIFTKSQLKMYKYYKSWDEYKEYFKKYECEAGICNIEEDRIPDAKISYQALQTLYDATEDEIRELCAPSNYRIQTISNSVENALSFYGVSLDGDTEPSGYFEKTLQIYPELLCDPACKDDLRDLKNSLVKKYRSAKLDVSGKFLFVLPDLYAFCEWLFMGISVPKGLLSDGEVFCRVYRRSEKLDCLRSPHLYIEHAVRRNRYNKKTRNIWLNDWFQTDAIYTSTYDLISRILQNDVDGDKLLVVKQPLIIMMAERVMDGVCPLYYEMKKAKSQEINPKNLYNGLILAFTGGKIGGISNEITKIWSSCKIDDDAKNAVKYLTMETNFTIDFAKTLYKPTRSAYADRILKQYAKDKVPYFFYYAKDKRLDQVEPINDCTINRIVKEIKDTKLMFRHFHLARIDYHVFLKDMEDNYNNEEINKVFDSWNKCYGNNIVFDGDDARRNNIGEVAKDILNELHKIEEDDDKIINSLVAFFYKKSSQRRKKLLWYVFGKQLYENVYNNIGSFTGNICHECGRRTKAELINGRCEKCRKKSNGIYTIHCEICGKEFTPRNVRMKYCAECNAERLKEYNRLAKRKERQKAKEEERG